MRNYKMNSYIVRTKNQSILMSSSSGGLFTPLAEFVLNNHGAVYAVRFNDSFVVMHDCIGEDDSLECTEQFRGSKYVQSNLGDTFCEVKKGLSLGSWYCFGGRHAK